MDLSGLIRDVQAAAEADSKGDLGTHGRLLQAIQKLNLAAETPAETSTRIIYQPLQNAALRVAVEMGLLKAIVVSERGSITAAELSQKVTGDTTLIVRVMRLLIAMGVCDEVGKEEYSANATTTLLASPGFTAGVQMLYDLFIPTAAQLIEYLHQSEFKCPEDIARAPFEYAFKAPHWEYLKHHPVHRARVDAYMAGRREGKLRWLDVFPAASQLGAGLSDAADAVLLVDVGGNQGHDLLTFQQRHPDLKGRLVLQDLPESLEKMPARLEGIEVMPYDFFTPQPIKDARAYFFRAICHDWSDKYCRDFLSHTARSMKKGYSSLLINDFVLPDTGTSLLPASLDILMMSFVAGAERTESQWRSLLDSVGLEIVKIWTVTAGAESVIETRLKTR